MLLTTRMERHTYLVFWKLSPPLSSWPNEEATIWFWLKSKPKGFAAHNRMLKKAWKAKPACYSRRFWPNIFLTIFLYQPSNLIRLSLWFLFFGASSSQSSRPWASYVYLFNNCLYVVFNFFHFRFLFFVGRLSTYRRRRSIRLSGLPKIVWSCL